MLIVCCHWSNLDRATYILEHGGWVNCVCFNYIAEKIYINLPTTINKIQTYIQ